jgi:acetyl-CoA carboxylase carboxyltransferase component
LRELVPVSERVAFDMKRFVRGLVDAGSFFEIQGLWAREVVVGFARLSGAVVGIVANNPMHKGGVLFVDSADKATRFIQLCDAFNVPLVFLADVPGFMVGTAVEKQGIIRHGAKLISAVSEATVPKFSVIVRKAYGAGLYAMAGPGFEPDATLALPTAKIAVMGAEAAVNAVHAKRLAAISDDDERAATISRLRAEYDEDIDVVRLASELVVDDIVEPEDLRGALIRRLSVASTKDRSFSRRRHGVTPV